MYSNTPGNIHMYLNAPDNIHMYSNTPGNIHMYLKTPGNIHKYLNTPGNIHMHLNTPGNIHMCLSPQLYSRMYNRQCWFVINAKRGRSFHSQVKGLVTCFSKDSYIVIPYLKVLCDFGVILTVPFNPSLHSL